MDWARVMRGIRSMAKLVTPASCSGFNSSPARKGSMMEMTRVPDFRPLVSSGSGRRTLATTSADPKATVASAAMVAPAFSYASSGMAAPSPAPFSTATSKPRLMSFFTVSGDAATRVSSGRCSLGIAIFIPGLSPCVPRNVPDYTQNAAREALGLL